MTSSQLSYIRHQPLWTTSTLRKDVQGKMEDFAKATENRPTHFKKAQEHAAISPTPMANPEDKSGSLIKVAEDKNTQDYLLPHPIWSAEEVDNVEITHRKPEGFVDKAAYYTVLALRKSFDLASGYTIGKNLQLLDERAVLIRCIFLETVAGKKEKNYFIHIKRYKDLILIYVLGVPGFSAAMIRHLHSLRRMERDHGWIHTLLEEAENERMHLITFLQLRRPGPIFRAAVIVSQWFFTAAFSCAYLISPKYCHR